MQEYYGSLPDYRILGSAQSERDLEDIVMRLYNKADRIFLKGGATQDQYDLWSHDLDNLATKIHWDRYTNHCGFMPAQAFFAE